MKPLTTLFSAGLASLALGAASANAEDMPSHAVTCKNSDGTSSIYTGEVVVNDRDSIVIELANGKGDVELPQQNCTSTTYHRALEASY